MIRILGLNAESVSHVWFSRALFFFGCIVVTLKFFKVVKQIENSLETHSKKLEERQAIRKHMIVHGVRVLLTTVGHLRTGFLTPLIVSNVVGLMILYENDVFRKYNKTKI